MALLAAKIKGLKQNPHQRWVLLAALKGMGRRVLVLHGQQNKPQIAFVLRDPVLHRWTQRLHRVCFAGKEANQNL